jgi:hypothetical protein
MVSVKDAVANDGGNVIEDLLGKGYSETTDPSKTIWPILMRNQRK